MLSSFPVVSSVGEYEVDIGHGLLDQALTRCDAIILDPQAVRSMVIHAPVVAVAACEAEKNLASVERVLIGLHEAGVRRGDSILAVGGGVIQDIATLAASLYMRGVSWSYVPSTMMAMLDSCVGGKSSINVAGLKNLVGNIYPPRQVSIDLALAQTLPIEARVAGYAEAVKICYAAGASRFEDFLAKHVDPEDYGSDPWMEQSSRLTEHVLTAKRWFIEVDEFDRKERLLLNFGHTFAHALESALNFSIPHGVAVAIGMAAATEFTPHKAERTAQLKLYIDSLARSLPADFAQRLNNPDWERFSVALASDKKSTTTFLRFVLPSDRGDLELCERVRSNDTYEEATAAAMHSLSAFHRAVQEPAR